MTGAEIVKVPSEDVVVDFTETEVPEEGFSAQRVTVDPEIPFVPPFTVPDMETEVEAVELPPPEVPPPHPGNPINTTNKAKKHHTGK